jgi:DNA-binding CsgD family transcriptional regulator
MSEIATGDLRELQSHLPQLYAEKDLAGFGRMAARIAQQLIDGDAAGYREISHSNRAINSLIEPASREQAILDRAGHFQRYAHQHPVFAHFRRQPHDEPKKISDFLVDAEFQQLELYREHHGPLGMNYEMAAFVGENESCHTLVTINRRARDFSERDRQLLALLQPHIRQAYDNAMMWREWQHKLDRVTSVLDQLEQGVLFVNRELKVLQTTPRAARFLNNQRDSEPTTAHLPHSIAEWGRAQIATCLASSDARPPLRPLTIPTKRGVVTLRLEPAKDLTFFSITLRSGPQPSDSDPFGILGLTRRQSEILLQLTQGKRNEQIARDLGISVRTVHKHLEHIYGKIRVSNRSEAISRALEWMR